MSTSAVTPQELEFKLGDGSVVKAASIEEAFKTVAKMKEDTAAELRRVREEAQSYRSQVDDFTAREQAARQAASGNTKEFNRDHYYQLLNQDPIEAQNYIDRHRFGVDNPVESFNYMRQSVDSLTQQTVAASFLQQHADDFPAGDAEAAKRLTERVTNLTNEGMPFNVRTLNLAYSELIQEGTIKPVEKTQDEVIVPNPSLTGGSSQAASQAELSKIENMSDKDLEALLRSKGLL